MQDQKLQSLLREADQTTAALAATPGTEAAVLRRRDRRRKVRSTGRAALLLLLVAGATSWFVHGRRRADIAKAPPRIDRQQIKQEVPPTNRRDEKQERAEFARLDQEASLHALTADALVQMQRAKNLSLTAEHYPADLGVATEVMVQQSCAAQVLVDQGDRLSARADEPQAAKSAYQRVLELFPRTPEAAVARDRLARM